ncbi:group I truncated hemoglobin [Natronobiforma cellulositropha]|uniref:group I truncated hemoglobin n=1 Tax=Natronobiforma cellulositropha TaxID=1679076 RepID=UPI0021D57243|nr:group 1 truncated hemoglobin [Natronobiforma cellulositropha]
MSEKTLYERLGGEDAIAAVVDEFYDRLLADETVAHFFEETDMQKQRAHQTAFLSAVAGGPGEYTGQDMETAHAHLEIDHHHFETIASHLGETLAAFDVGEDEREAVLEAVSSYEDEVVTVA